MAIERSGQGHGVGASVLRKEDDRHLRGRGQFVADIQLQGTHSNPPRGPATS
jgi:carbon-monoxide dehydrogenase large subunit